MKWVFWIVVGVAIACGAAVAGESTLQFAEDTAVSRDLSGTSPTRVCRTGARWMKHWRD